MNNLIMPSHINANTSKHFEIHEQFTDPPIGKLNTDLIDKIMNGHEIMPFGRQALTINFSGSYSYNIDVLKTLNIICKKYKDRIRIAFHTHHSEKGFNARYLDYLPDARLIRISVDDLHTPEALSSLKNINSLELLISNGLPENILELANLHKLTSLSIGQLKKKGVDLAPLSEYRNLNQLSIHNKANGLHHLKHHKTLADVWLYGLSHKTELTPLNELPALKKLKIWFGSRENLTELNHQALTSLDICHIKGLKGLDLTCFAQLLELSVEQQAKVTSLNLAPASQLTTVRVKQCKLLNQLIGFDSLKKLRTLSLDRLPEFDFNNLISNDIPPSLENFIGIEPTGRRSEDKAILKKLVEIGISINKHTRQN
ncbi:hypothetical protein [Thorsellia anophelis]|uniref:Internalin A n=1 Tax=Thorsellia anophelis DSM 18579 TaxID=1123402 RepID=A0A1H9ZYG3_9GAMM|nr:hypothetical protein [Thorsellia anophelis]SES85930.1 hypothetical protein SAMN02583745_00731 [Thorsellia anophelis DSM 18579]